MKILIINGGENSNPGGINKTVRETAKNLSALGHHIFLLQDNPNNKPERELTDGYQVIRIKSPGGKYLYGINLKILFNLKKLLSEIEPDIVHVHAYHTLLALEISLLIRNSNFKMPIVFSPHLDVYKSTFAGKYFWNIYDHFGKSLFKHSDHIVSFSKFEANNLMNSYNIDKQNITIIPHGVNFIDYQQKIYNKNTCKLLYSGHLVERKGVNYIIESLNHLINVLNFKNVELTIIGDGPEKSNLKSLSKKYNLDNHVIWKSFLSDERYIKEIKSSDMFLLLSNSEAYGITVAEALALGTPCIVTKNTAIKEFLNETGCFGVDYPPDPEEVANMVLKIYHDQVKVGPFTEKIRTWDKVARDYEKLYSNLLKTDDEYEIR